MNPQVDRKKRHVFWLVVILCGMFAFTYALVPFYKKFCQITGLNGKLEDGGRTRLPSQLSIDTTRNITVQFTAIVHNDIPWTFYPYTPKVQVHPGETRQVIFHVKNNANREIIGQAIPSISPGLAARHFRKTECFCFSRQKLGPGESRDMPLVFYLDPELPAEIKELTLAYSLLDTRADKILNNPVH